MNPQWRPRVSLRFRSAGYVGVWGGEGECGEGEGAPKKKLHSSAATLVDLVDLVDLVVLSGCGTYGVLGAGECGDAGKGCLGRGGGGKGEEGEESEEGEEEGGTHFERGKEEKCCDL